MSMYLSHRRVFPPGELSTGCGSPLALSCKERGPHPFDPCFQTKQVPGKRKAGASFRTQADGSRGDVEFVQVTPSKGTTGWPRDGNLYHPLDTARGRIAQDFRSIPARAPEVFLAIHRQAVRPERGITQGNQNTTNWSSLRARPRNQRRRWFVPPYR